jgi:DNA invertase Pin-like site-specific DNA recombinase
MAKEIKRAALYVRVSTDHQSVENQIRELRQVAEHRGWQVAEVYRDTGVSGAKGRDQRPGLDALLRMPVAASLMSSWRGPLTG